jgi:hypothetical protein
MCAMSYVMLAVVVIGVLAVAAWGIVGRRRRSVKVPLTTTAQRPPAVLHAPRLREHHDARR